MTRRQVTEIPIIKPLVIETRQHETVSPHRQKINRGALPEGLDADRFFGPRLEATAVYYKHRHYMSYERIVETLRDRYRMTISEGAIAQIHERAGKKAASDAEAIREQVDAKALQVGHLFAQPLRVRASSDQARYLHQPSDGDRETTRRVAGPEGQERSRLEAATTIDQTSRETAGLPTLPRNTADQQRIGAGAANQRRLSKSDKWLPLRLGREILRRHPIRHRDCDAERRTSL